MNEEDVLAIVEAIGGLRNAVCRPAVPWTTEEGNAVGDLTEAVVYVGASLRTIAEAISDLAEAVRESKSP